MRLSSIKWVEHCQHAWHDQGRGQIGVGGLEEVLSAVPTLGLWPLVHTTISSRDAGLLRFLKERKDNHRGMYEMKLCKEEIPVNCWYCISWSLPVNGTYCLYMLHCPGCWSFRDCYPTLVLQTEIKLKIRPQSVGSKLSPEAQESNTALQNILQNSELLRLMKQHTEDGIFRNSELTESK